MFAKVLLWVFALLSPSLPALPIIHETPVVAGVVCDCVVYEEKTMEAAAGRLSAGDSVEILQDFSALVYKVMSYFDGTTGWVAAECLQIPAEWPTDKSSVTSKQLENFVNTQKYASPTGHLLLTDINRQKLHVFYADGAKWRHKKSFDCATGLNISPTTRGTFSITERGPWFYSERLASGAKFWMRFNDQYLIHSIPMDKAQKPLPGQGDVGQKGSNGCIRLALPDVKWLYENIPDGTTIVVI